MLCNTAPPLPPTVGGITLNYKHTTPPTGGLGMDALCREDHHVHLQGGRKERRGGGSSTNELVNYTTLTFEHCVGVQQLTGAADRSS